MSQFSRLAPEFFPVKQVLLALPYEGSDWQDLLDEVLGCYAGIVRTLLAEDEGLELIVLARNDARSQRWFSDLRLCEKQAARLSFITHIAYNDTWVRDYGPLSLLHGEQTTLLSFHFNGWGGKYPAELDNAVAAQLSDVLATELKSIDVVIEGGALEINSQGVMLINSDCLVDDKRNAAMNLSAICQTLKDTLGATELEVINGVCFTGDDTDGHIDTLARIVSDSQVVACGRSKHHPDSEALDRLNDQLEAICLRRGWQLITLPVPKVYSRIDHRLLPATYANFLLCNQCLFLPVYGQEQDAQAIAILQKALPEYKIVAIQCAPLVEQHGSLHCATMQLA